MLFHGIRAKAFYTLASLCIFTLVRVANSDVPDRAMKFTYGDSDQLGPSHWKNKKGVEKVELGGRLLGRTFGRRRLPPTADDSLLYQRNLCKTNWLSPINIIKKSVNAPDLGKVATHNAVGAHLAGEDIPETLVITLTKAHIEKTEWSFGHPSDNRYHGIEIRPPSFGVLLLIDNFDPLLDTSDPTFEFNFLTLFYCDLKKVGPGRSMHQIDGERYPLELHFVFSQKKNKRDSYNGPKGDEEEGSNENPALFGGDSITVTVIVHGEVGPNHNKYFQPVADAAKEFRGKDFEDETEESTDVIINSPWSATWLLPDNSDYYYYDDGSFPVPPCWKVARYYILGERIQISQAQLDALTNIISGREKESGSKLPCTFSLLQQDLLSGEVTVNLMDYEFRGDDNKPRTPEEMKLWRARKQRMREFRKRLEGRVSVLDKTSGGHGIGETMNKETWLNIQLVLIMVVLLITITH